MSVFNPFYIFVILHENDLGFSVRTGHFLFSIFFFTNNDFSPTLCCEDFTRYTAFTQYPLFLITGELFYHFPNIST